MRTLPTSSSLALLAAGVLLSQTLSPMPTGAQSAGEPSVSIEARGVQPGEVVVIVVTTAAAVDDVSAMAFDRRWQAWRADELTWKIAIGIDLDTPAGTHPVDIRAGTARIDHPLEVTAKSFPTRQLTVEPQYVDPPADVLERILREAEELSAVWAGSAPERLWEDPFVRPVPHEANSAFGSRSVFNGQPRSPHGGADFRSPAGTPVHAPNAGRVVVAGDLYYTGGTVAIDHGLGLVSLFAHLSRIDVEVGARVEASDVVGLVGATGRVTGPHLHWTLRANGTRVDPLSLLAVLGS